MPLLKMGGVTGKLTILRHDIDTSIEKAVCLAELEHELGVRSTYFVLLTSDFYNVASKRSMDGLHRIQEAGHDIGLHFDEMAYPESAGKPDQVKAHIIHETEIFGSLLGTPVRTISYHRPSKEILDAELEIPGLINSYGKVFFRGYKYLSDSRRRWREPVLDIIRSMEYDRLHILTHAFWYSAEEMPIHDTVAEFVKGGNDSRWQSMNENISDFNSILPREEIL